MRVDEVKVRRRAPVTEQARLNVFELRWLTQQRIVIFLSEPLAPRP